MKKFLISFLLFLVIGVITPAIILYSLPPTPFSKSSMIFQAVRNDSAMNNTPSPRIIFVGGSNTSFGLISPIFKDSLHLNPVNTGIHASIGLMYMLDRVEPMIKKGDLVVVIPEYHQFIDDYAYGGDILLSTVIDVDNRSLLSLHRKQLKNITKFLSNYCFSKLKPAEYKPSTIPHYTISAYNNYGDVYSHYGLPHENIGESLIEGEINESVIDYLKKSESILTQKGATVLISYPSFAQTPFNRNIAIIKKIKKALAEKKFKIAGTPERYSYPDSLFFNTIYHLTDKGAELRSKLLIEDIKKIVGNPK